MTPASLLGIRVQLGRGRKVWTVTHWDPDRALITLTTTGPSGITNTTIAAENLDRLRPVDLEA